MYVFTYVRMYELCMYVYMYMYVYVCLYVFAMIPKVNDHYAAFMICICYEDALCFLYEVGTFIYYLC